MMPDYIERWAAIEAAKKTPLYFDIKPIIISIPAADVRPVLRGAWKAYNNTYVCSVCGRPVSFWKSDFCPNCGADMRGANNA